jgi:hypothetical protein
MTMTRVYDCLAPCNTIPCSAASSDACSRLVNIRCTSCGMLFVQVVAKYDQFPAPLCTCTNAEVFVTLVGAAVEL